MGSCCLFRLYSEGEKQRVQRNSEARKDTEKHDKYSEGKCSEAQLGSTECSTGHSAVKHSNNHGKHSAKMVKAGGDSGDGYRKASNQLNSTVSSTYIEIAYIYVPSKEEEQTTQRNSERRENHKMYSEDQCSEAQRGSAERSTQHGAAINTALQKEVI